MELESHKTVMQYSCFYTDFCKISLLKKKYPDINPRDMLSLSQTVSDLHYYWS